MVINQQLEREKSSDVSIQIDRIEVPPEKRRQRLAALVIMKLAIEAKIQGVDLSASVCPDRTNDIAVTDGLRRAFCRAGFTPLEMDGEVYRNDVELHRSTSPKP